MEKTNCVQCKEIIEFEQQLDARAEVLVQRVKDFCRPVRERNNERWRKFAKWCQLPLVGNIIFNKFKVPPGLESEPEYYEEQWYREEGKLIRIEARKLEEMKVADMEHWGDEDVSPADITDLAGYYTPSIAPRKECYARGFTAFEPKKYDFGSAAGVDKFKTENLVLCSRTKQLVLKTQCSWKIGVDTGWKPVYFLKEFVSPKKPCFPGYNEWRDDDYYSKHPEHDPQNW